MFKNWTCLLKVLKRPILSQHSRPPCAYLSSMTYYRPSTHHLSKVFLRTFQSVNNPEPAQMQDESSLPAIDPSISDFTTRIEEKLPTVDKTRVLYKVLTQATSVFVMGPRRFGKSMNISTLVAIFQNGADWWRKNCPDFKIVQAKYEFPVHPTIDFDFSGKNNVDQLQRYIIVRLRNILIAEKLMNQNFDILRDAYLKSKSQNDFFDFFYDAITTLARKGKVVLLIDEYNAPISFAVERLLFKSPDYPEISNHPDVEELISFFVQLFLVIKSLKNITKLFYITGTVPISQLGLFSGANNVIVLRRNPDYDGIIGYTEKEILEIFSKNIEDAANRKFKGSNESPEDRKDKIMAEITKNYDGFLFRNDQQEPLYSPYSINNLFEEWRASITRFNYPPYFHYSGSSRLIWILVQQLKLHERTKFYWHLLTNKSELKFEVVSAEILENQRLESLYKSFEKIGFYSGVFSVCKGSNPDYWHLKITNEEMRKAYFEELVSVSRDDLDTLLAHLSNEDYCKYFHLLNKELIKLSAFTPLPNQVKHKFEVEAYGHVLFALFHERLSMYLEAIKKDNWFKNARLEIIKDKAISVVPTRPDCLVLIDGLVKKNNKNDVNDANDEKSTASNEMTETSTPIYKKICINIEFKCYDDVEEALREAKNDLIKKRENIKKLTMKYSQIEDYDMIFVAGALGFGQLQKIEIYNLKDDQLTLCGSWPGELKPKRD